ncbi:acyl-CoA thioesterase [Halopelagius longus]|uniref:Acyl-CoA thioesterase n=1 Tax=Halopelagius longus TaxID=1236180 RepID=A0A370IQG2_9EURY|nr:thioesterase family protein [Halopelagius longus]RDI72958.1 acyl-CoA thioesterase [Halopelagius longus]
MPYRAEVDVRFQDLDAVGHVNNAVYATYCEQARVDFFEDVIGLRSTDLNIVLASLQLQYRKPIEGTGTVSVELDVPEVGNSSFTMAYELTYEGEVVATGESVQVVVDPETRESVRVPDSWREAVGAEAGSED